MNKKSFIAVLFILIIALPMFGFGAKETLSNIIEPIKESEPTSITEEKQIEESKPPVLSTEMSSSISTPYYSVELIEERVFTKEEVESIRASLSSAYGTEISFDEALDYVIDQELFNQGIQRALNNGEISLESEEFTNYYSQQLVALATQNGIQLTSEQDATAFIQMMGEESYNAFVNYVAQTYAEEYYVLSHSNGKFDSIEEPTELEVKETYNAYKSSFVSEEAVYVAQIEINYGEDKDLAKTKADSALYNIRKGLPWSDAVKTYSEDPYTVSYNGEFGVWIYPSTTGFVELYGQDAFDLLFSLEKGTISEVFEGPDAYYIYNIIDHKDSTLLKLDDLYDYNSTETVADYIKYVLYQEKQSVVYSEILDEIFVSLREEATLKSLV